MILILWASSVIVSSRIHWPTAQNQAVHWLRLVGNQVKLSVKVWQTHPYIIGDPIK